MVPIEDDLVVTDESIPGWALVTTEEGDGYVSTDYVTLTTEYVQAESKAEEEARLAKEEAEREAAAAAAASARKKNSESSSQFIRLLRFQCILQCTDQFKRSGSCKLCMSVCR